MKLLIESIMIFFATLVAAALVALGEPASADLAVIGAATGAAEPVQRQGVMEHLSRVWGEVARTPGPR